MIDIRKFITEGINDKNLFKIVFLAGGPGCFAGETLVKTEKGNVPICEIKVGDEVYTLDETTGKVMLKKVEHLFEYSVMEDLMEIEIETDEKIVCTKGHKFRLQNGEWKEAQYLTIEDELYGYEDSMIIKAIKTVQVSATTKVYDIQVKDNHNYYITEKGVNVHNSGKSFVSNTMFGVSKGHNVSFMGVKVVNSDFFFEKGLKALGLPLEIDDANEEVYFKQMDVRRWAKIITSTRQGLLINGMLPLIIDGTGKEFDDIRDKAERFKGIGYDVAMVFINTSLDVAIQRNKERERVVPINVVVDSWEAVQGNMGKFQRYFGQSNFYLVDNSESFEKGSSEAKSFSDSLFKLGAKIIQKPLVNKKGITILKKLRKTGGKYLSDLAK